MANRFVSVWFRHLSTDWFSLNQPQLKTAPFVLRTPSHGKMIITSANAVALTKGIELGMALADARAIIPELEVSDDKPELADKLLTRLAEWCIRFTPTAAIDPPDGIILDATGCAHLWGGDKHYLATIIQRITERGYDISAAMADTVGAAWAIARYGKACVIDAGMHQEAILSLPPQALRIDAETVQRLHKLGLHRIEQFITMPRSSLRRRFGNEFLQRLDMIAGNEEEMIRPVLLAEQYHERLPCLEPIVTATGIEIALQRLLNMLCHRLQQEQKGLRSAIFKSYRVDGRVEQVAIDTNRPSHSVRHLYKLFECKLSSIEPDLGIELFVLEAPEVEDQLPVQEKLWEGSGGLEDIRVSELIDRIGSRTGIEAIHRYVPDEHYWPERSFKVASLYEKLTTVWRTDRPRPLLLLEVPERVDVTAPIPDYPPMLFRYKGEVHKIKKADGPERIEQEWWLQQGQHRDYYRVEDEYGQRYWLFRLGHYDDEVFQWFIHGFFA